MRKLGIMRRVVLLFLFYFGISTFNQADNCRYYGSIHGWDSTRCGCCEGWIIEIDGKRYLADSIPNARELFKSPYKKTYPILVFLDYEKKIGGCDNRIVIKCIKLR